MKRYILDRVSVDEDEMSRILRYFRPMQLGRNRHLLRRGQIASGYVFIEEGCLRIYYHRDEQEITGWATCRNLIFTDLSSLLSRQPSVFNIQALESSRLYLISHQDMQHLYDTIPKWQELGRKLWEEAFVSVLNMIVSYQTETAEERYERLLAEPGLLQKVPLKHLATFLGITPSSLSRLRRNRK
ncbi:Crp/Fnr family transcriptional regulator [Larkinella soli]|uniref:Crp/Fnr family transcriptional regulator n=1 Tax=Larkinella soli TaxID=1770527 RepID=UPI0013E3EFD6|nr:cyclic nucleotide-binding domain-containing protein [Larkinella soli]